MEGKDESDGSVMKVGVSFMPPVCDEFLRNLESDILLLGRSSKSTLFHPRGLDILLFSGTFCRD